MVGNDSRHIEEEGPLRLTTKSVRHVEGVFLGHTSNRKRLAWKAGKKHIMFWDVAFVDFRDVTVYFMVTAKILSVSLLCVFVPLACVDTFAANCFEAATHPTYASEEVYECKLRY